MATFSETKPYTFSSFCNSFNLMEVPKFQRPYDWKNKQLQDFFSSIKENEKEYFIGNIVSVDSKDIESSVGIIDGQQRITTIFLLLCALKNIANEFSLSKDSDSEAFNTIVRKIDNLLSYHDYDLAEDISRLKINRDAAQKIFNKIVSNENINISELETDIEKKYFRNFNLLKKYIGAYIKNSELERIKELFEKIRSLQFISIICSSEDEVYKIFEGFNSTGLGLNAADLVKNSILQIASVNGALDDAEATWNEAEQLFDSTSLTRFPKFLRYQWISRNGYISNSDLHGVIRDEKIKSFDTSIKVSNYLNELLSDAQIYAGMIYEQHEGFLTNDTQVVNSLKKFRYLQGEQIYFVLMAYYRSYLDKKIKKSYFINLLDKLWIFSLRTRYVSISPSDYERIFASHALNISNSEDSDEISKYADVFLNKISKLVSNEEQFIDNLANDISYPKDKKLIKELFLRLMKKDNPEISISEPEIEHIIPQKPQKWKLKLSDVKDYINDLGNLTLLFSGDNKDAGNETFDIKKEIFKNSSFKINKDIVENWSSFPEKPKEVVLERGLEIAKMIEKINKF